VWNLNLDASLSQEDRSFKQNRRQKVFNRGALPLFRGAWHSEIWQKLHRFIVLHNSIWGLRTLFGGLSPQKPPRGDGTAFIRDCIDKMLCEDRAATSWYFRGGQSDCNLLFYLTTKKVFGVFIMLVKISGGTIVRFPLLFAGVNEVSTSLCPAQVLIVKDQVNRYKKRFCYWLFSHS